MEETSGIDLADFFDFWVHAGRVPDVKVEVRIADNNSGCFAEALVDVDRAFGTFAVPGRGTDAAVTVDPVGPVRAQGHEGALCDQPTSGETR